MCGIAVSLDTTARRRAEPWALPHLRHRGPDAEGVIVESGLGLVMEHTRLAILDPANRESDQPFSDPSGRWMLVYNGELFNFRQLRRELECRGFSFRTESDTEVVLHAVVSDWPGALASFRGMFAFAVWDRKTRELLAARDQIGVKPFYYAMIDGLFIAASELRTMLAHPVVPKRLDPVGVVQYLAFGFVPGERTLIEGVRKLPPGHALRLHDGKLEVFEYWDVLPTDARNDVGGAEVLEHVDDAVAAAVVSDVPVSLMLSGGLDSSCISALAVRHLPAHELTAYSVAFGVASDEAEAASQLAAELGLRHREIRLTERHVAERFEDWLRETDVPTANPTWIAVSAIAHAVREDGIKVLLSGDGGDELFGGYNRWMTYLRFHDLVWNRSPRMLRALGGRLAQPVLRGLAGDIARRARDGGDLFVGSRPFHDDDLAGALGPVTREAAVDVPPESYIEQLRQRFDERNPRGDYLAWMSYAALKTDLVEDYLVRLDTMGMNESVEGRVPLLDPVLARWAFSIPQSVKVNGYEQKALFRRAVEPLLPRYITSRPKQGFCPPVGAWATSTMLQRLHGVDLLVDEGVIAPGWVDRMTTNRSVGASFATWGLGSLAAWCNHNL